MKLDSNTTKILKTFSSINNALLIKEGNVVRTISPSKTVMAKATLNQDFPKTFAIDDVSRFLGTVSMFDNPDLTFGENSVVINNGGATAEYHYTSPSLIVVAPDKDINLDNAEVRFHLTGENIMMVQRALGVISLPEVAFVGKGGRLYLQAVDSKTITNDSYSIDIGETSSNFRMIIRSDNLKVAIDNYDVKISSKGLSHFKGSEGIEYWVAVEGNSTIG